METENYSITIIFPNQLFKNSPILNEDVKKNLSNRRTVIF